MKRGLYLLSLFLLLFNLVFAQSTDTVLQNYSLAFENLNKATEVFGSDTQQSIEALNDASQMLRPLSTGADSTVIPGLERTFERAKTSIQNQSLSDLEIQVAVLKGGFWRLVYESALRAGENNDLASSRVRLAQIATDMGLDPAISEKITNSDQILAMLSNLESGVAQQMQIGLTSLQSLLASSDFAAVKAELYKQLATAYSLYLPIQDSPRSSAQLNEAFTVAFGHLVNSDQAALSTDLENLNTHIGGLLAASQAMTGSTLPVSNEVNNPTPSATTDPSEPEIAAPVEVSSPVASTTVDAGSETSIAQTTVVEPSATATVPSTSISTVTEASAVNSEELRRQLIRLGLANTQQDRLIELYGKQGFNSLNDVIDKLYVDSAKVIVAMNQGNPGRAQSLIGSLDSTYSTYLKSILDQTNPSFGQSLQGLFRHLQTVPALRLQDTVVLTDHIDSLASVISNNAVSLNKTEVMLTGIWSGWLRLIIVFLLGLAAFLPLYLLYLAFGGGNRNWQLIGWSLFCLLLPLMFEGLTYLSSLISSFAGDIPFLNTLSRYSIFQSTLSQIIWVIVSGAAITLATLGLYGICVQFGLLGQRKQNQNQTVVETSSETGAGAATSFDWDEEF